MKTIIRTVWPSAFGGSFASRALLILLVCFGGFHALAAGKDQVIINEIMYNPPGDDDRLQYVELFNRGDAEVLLDGWGFTKGIQFRFPDGTKLGPSAYLVLCRDPASFAGHYGQGIMALGPFSGKLSRKKDRLDLSNASGQVIDSVSYSDSGSWPRGADGYSSSLERICPFDDAAGPENWAASELPASKRATGTPGKQNDNFQANLPPVISQVEFAPGSPAPQQKVTVTARVEDPDGLKAVTLLYRTAGTGRESEERTLAMSRTSGDANGGVYQATLPGQPSGELVRFRIQAADAAGTVRFEPAPNEPRPTYSYFSFTNTVNATIPQAFLVNISPATQGPRHYDRNPKRSAAAASVPRGNGALLYVPAEGGAVETFDYVRIVKRHGGWKVHFQKDRPLKEMTGINLLSEGPMRWTLAEPLSYIVYRMADVPAPLAEHVRVTVDGRPLGFQLLVEQPNKSFLDRNGRDTSGNMYKLIWYGQGLIGQHEKKTNPSTGHADLVALIDGLKKKSGADQWAFIEQHVNVEEFASYYAVNMCIQNWDGFFNNYFAYHDIGGTGKWEIYPWDEDKTWGDYDGASPRYDWYEMPLTLGMNGDRPSQNLRSRFSGGGGPFGGVSWWRPPGHFSGPLLANREFRRQFLFRLNELCSTVFTEETLLPMINAMERRLEPEVRWYAQVRGQDVRQAQREFSSCMQSFRNQLQHRRQFILAELAKLR